jgi:ATP-dependent DNA helicase RecQ
VPPAVSGDLVKNFASAVGNTLGFTISHDLIKTKTTREQKVFQNAVLKRDNVKDVFDYKGDEKIAGKSILLIDDILDSGATIKEIGRMLSKKGASMIAPLVIAKTVGGDLT